MDEVLSSHGAVSLVLACGHQIIGFSYCSIEARRKGLLKGLFRVLSHLAQVVSAWK